MEGKVLETLNAILEQSNIQNVTAESAAAFSELPDGYYLCEVIDAKLKESSKNDPMASFRFKVVENGHAVGENGEFQDLMNTANRNIFINYVLKDDASVKRFVSDMLKFEGDEEGKSILGKEYFTNADVLEDALDILIGLCIYVQVSTSEKSDGSKSTWQNLISWKRAATLELPL